LKEEKGIQKRDCDSLQPTNWHGHPVNHSTSIRLNQQFKFIL